MRFLIYEFAMNKFSSINKNSADRVSLVDHSILKVSDAELKKGDSSPGLKDSKRLTLKEREGFERPDPTRYGDWEYKGRCIDF